MKLEVGFNLEIEVKRRKGYFAATTTPFAITTYGETSDEATERASKAVLLILNNNIKKVDWWNRPVK